MNIPDTVNILGTEYKIVKTDKNDSIFEDSNSMCVVCKDDKKIFIAAEETCDSIIRKRRKTPVFRHGDIRRVHLICVSN